LAAVRPAGPGPIGKEREIKNMKGKQKELHVKFNCLAVDIAGGHYGTGDNINFEELSKDASAALLSVQDWDECLKKSAKNIIDGRYRNYIVDK
jgi:hypothetical protein